MKKNPPKIIQSYLHSFLFHPFWKPFVMFKYINSSQKKKKHMDFWASKNPGPPPTHQRLLHVARLLHPIGARRPDLVEVNMNHLRAQTFNFFFTRAPSGQEWVVFCLCFLFRKKTYWIGGDCCCCCCWSWFIQWGCDFLREPKCCFKIPKWSQRIAR